LNMIIRKKLREYLPSDVFTHPGFLQKLEWVGAATREDRMFLRLIS
jgi:hypothetical protein